MFVYSACGFIACVSLLPLTFLETILVLKVWKLETFYKIKSKHWSTTQIELEDFLQFIELGLLSLMGSVLFGSTNGLTLIIKLGLMV